MCRALPSVPHAKTISVIPTCDIVSQGEALAPSDCRVKFDAEDEPESECDEIDCKRCFNRHGRAWQTQDLQREPRSPSIERVDPLPRKTDRELWRNERIPRPGHSKSDAHRITRPSTPESGLVERAFSPAVLWRRHLKKVNQRLAIRRNANLACSHNILGVQLLAVKIFVGPVVGPER